MALTPARQVQADYSKLMEAQRRKADYEAMAADKVRLPEMSAAEFENRGDAYLKRGIIDGAFLSYDKASRLDPQNSRLRYKKGRLFLQKNMREAAKREFEMMLSQNRDDPLGHEGMGRVFFKERNFAEAEISLNRAVEGQAGLWEAHNLLGLIYDSRRDHEAAIGHYLAALLTNPDEALTLNNLGLSYYLNGQLKEASGTFEKAIEAGVADEKTLNNYAMVLGASGQYDQALAVLKQVGEDSKAYNNLGIILTKKGDYLHAKQAFEKAIDASPGYFAKAHDNLRMVEDKISEGSLTATPVRWVKATNSKRDHHVKKATTSVTEPATSTTMHRPVGTRLVPAAGASKELIVAGASLSVEKGPQYDTSYVKIDYPGGDPGWERGANTDLVIRAFRHAGIDLQEVVHLDLKADRSPYGIEKLNTSYDHRRVKTLARFFALRTQTLETGKSADWRPGDIVVWDLEGGDSPNHVGVVSDKLGPDGHPLVIHHRRQVGPFTGHPSEDDVLFEWSVVGHYRWPGSEVMAQPELPSPKSN
ncbi:MAG: DUF1287 domain-containing protein [bacterium]|nr:DUF1287 domain-containing protein [bacterium]